MNVAGKSSFPLLYIEQPAKRKLYPLCTFHILRRMIDMSTKYDEADMMLFHYIEYLFVCPLRPFKSTSSEKASTWLIRSGFSRLFYISEFPWRIM